MFIFLRLQAVLQAHADAADASIAQAHSSSVYVPLCAQAVSQAHAMQPLQHGDELHGEEVLDARVSNACACASASV